MAEAPRLGFVGCGWIGRHRLQAIVSSDVAHRARASASVRERHVASAAGSAS